MFGVLALETKWGEQLLLWKALPIVQLCLHFAVMFSETESPPRGWQWWEPTLSYLIPLSHVLIRSKIPGRVEASLLHSKGSDEDVEDDCDEDESCGSVVQYIQAGLLGNVIQVQTSCAIQCKKRRSFADWLQVPSSCKPPLPGKCSWCPWVLRPPRRGSSHRNAMGATGLGWYRRLEQRKNSPCFDFLAKFFVLPWKCCGPAMGQP